MSQEENKRIVQQIGRDSDEPLSPEAAHEKMLEVLRDVIDAYVAAPLPKFIVESDNRSDH
jgi:hypothetical protein